MPKNQLSGIVTYIYKDKKGLPLHAKILGIMYPNEVDSMEKAKKLIEESPALLMYFYSDKCAPCFSLRPKVVELVCDKFPKLKLSFIDAENQPELAARFNAFGLPVLILFFEGKEYNRDSKFIAIPQLADTINRPYTLLFS